MEVGRVSCDEDWRSAWGRLENMLVAAEVYGEINKSKFETMSPFNKINNCEINYVVCTFTVSLSHVHVLYVILPAD